MKTKIFFILSLLVASSVHAEEIPIILSASWCPVCVVAKEFLESKGEMFQSLDIDTSNQGKDLMKKSGALGPPVLVVDGNFYAGFDPVTWMRVLHKGHKTEAQLDRASLTLPKHP